LSMLVRVGHAARIKLPATTSRVSESLPASLFTRSSERQDLRPHNLNPNTESAQMRLILIPANKALQPNRPALEVPTYDAGANFNDGCRLPEYIAAGRISSLTGAPVVGAPSLFKLALTKQCFV